MWDREFFSTHFRSLTAAVLLLAGFNLMFRINDTAITEWDESLYAMSAVEMIESGDWVATRLNGQVDDTIITKPPLTVWLTALSFKTFGITPFALRLTSVVSACTGKEKPKLEKAADSPPRLMPPMPSPSAAEPQATSMPKAIATNPAGMPRG